MKNIDTRSVNSIRVLSADAVQKANSGHPGLPLGAAPMAYELWAHHMKHNPQNPDWANRDRFILSAGHGSAMLYALLHLFGYGNLPLSELQQFRQLGSLTPGHPEYRHTVGVEATTGPLGAGMAMGVGMAMAEAHLASVFNKESYPVVDHHTFVLAGDGCMMEGISSEAMSLAGTLKLNKLIVLYDSNNISIEGDTEIAFTENVAKRFESYGFHVLHVADGTDLDAIGKAIEEAKAFQDAPTMIEIKTKIGFGSAREGKASAHGEPLGAENITLLKEKLGYDSQDEFHVPADVYDNFKQLAAKNADEEASWTALFEKYCAAYPEMADLWKQFHDPKHGLDALGDTFWNITEKADATRNISGAILNHIKDIFQNLFGGSADLAPSNKTNLKDAGDFSASTYAGRNIHFGVRELAMAGIGNGLALHGGLRPYVSTFFVFSDYTKPMLRLASIMELPVLYIFTHDSIGVGEDGPTHEPIEQLAMLRSQPNFTVYRPADATETAAAYYYALTSQRTPTALVLTRQNLPQLAGSSKDALKGAYVISEAKDGKLDAIVIATGSEVELALRAQEALAAEQIHVRVVSMPSMDVFEAQSKEYKEQILPSNIRKRVAVEALSSFGWDRYVGLDGTTVTMNSFGASAPAAVLFEHFGFTVSNVVAAVKSIL